MQKINIFLNKKAYIILQGTTYSMIHLITLFKHEKILKEKRLCLQKMRNSIAGTEDTMKNEDMNQNCTICCRAFNRIRLS